MDGEKGIKVAEVSIHSSRNDCWVVVNGQVWDVTSFMKTHPGGEDVIFKHAGKDASYTYNQAHSPKLLAQTLPSTNFKGGVVGDLPSSWLPIPETTHEKTEAERSIPPLSTILSLHDLEASAKEHLSKKAWAYYSSAATDLVSERANRALWEKIWFRPRIMRNVKNVNTKRIIHGVNSSTPFCVAPAAMAKLANEAGELAIAKSCAKTGVIQCISINASYQVEEVIAAAPPGTPFFFQIYINKDRSSSENLLRRVWDEGIRVLIVTVDAPVPGKREADEKVKTSGTVQTPMTGTMAASDTVGSGLTRTMGTYIDSELCWEDLDWVRSIWKGKLVLKGIQTVEDAVMAAEARVDGIILSNHGGRNLDNSPPGLMVLLEIRKHCPQVFEKLEVHVDGGIRRGADILKAVCLGATSVLIGRPFLYSVLYGEEGVEHIIRILKDELETAMRLAGITDLSQVHPGIVTTRELDHLVETKIQSDSGEYTLKSKI